MKARLDPITLQSFANGEETGFRRVYDHFYLDLQYFTQDVLKDREQAEDITLESFARLFQRHATFQTEQHLKGFLFKTAKNQCIDYLKIKKRRDARSEGFLASLSTQTDDEQSYTNSLIESGVLPRILEEVEKLPAQCGKVFKLYYFEHQPIRTIAEQLGVGESTVRSHKKHALDLLRIALADHAIALLFLQSLLMAKDHLQ